MDKTNIFDEVESIKAKVEKEVLENQKLMKLLSIGKDNPLKEPDIEKASKLVDQYIFFKPKTYSTVEGVQCFLLMDLSAASYSRSEDFLEIDLTFRVIVHNTLFELFDGKTRAYQIAKQISNSFNNEEGNWMGKCKLKKWHSIDVPADYQGIQLTFKMGDLNR